MATEKQSEQHTPLDSQQSDEHAPIVIRTEEVRQSCHEPQAGVITIVVFSAILQLAICFVIVFGDIGFDHPGRFGLDFEHFLLMLATQVTLTLLSAGAAIWDRQWNLLAFPMLAVVLTFVALAAA